MQRLGQAPARFGITVGGGQGMAAEPFLDRVSRQKALHLFHREPGPIGMAVERLGGSHQHVGIGVGGPLGGGAHRQRSDLGIVTPGG